VLRYDRDGIQALARAEITYGQIDSDRQACGIAVDGAGNYYGAFPEGSIIAEHDVLLRFAANFPTGGGVSAGRLFGPLAKSDGLAVDRLNRLYVTREARDNGSARVDIISTAHENTILQILKKRLLRQVHDIAIDSRDNVYVTSTETQHFGNVPYTVSRVTRYAGILSGLPLPDMDNDGEPDASDNCPSLKNVNQADSDGDDRGDVCDNCPAAENRDQADGDHDGWGDRCDLCPLLGNDGDTDDDGIPDSVEDANGNGRVDPGDTDPCLGDTDVDGIQDGTEKGYTAADIDANTDTQVFQPDLDPTTRTDPLVDDTDGDGLLDGQEDLNHNGRVDRGKTYPNEMTETCIGDLDRDLDADGHDLAPLAIACAAYYCSVECPEDLNGDGVVEAADVELFLEDFGTPVCP